MLCTSKMHGVFSMQFSINLQLFGIYFNGLLASFSIVFTNTWDGGELQSGGETHVK